MNLSTFNFSLIYAGNQLVRSLFRPILICLFLLSLYQTLIYGGVLPASDGINAWQNNVVKSERYIYQNYASKKMVLVGSSLANRLSPEFFDTDIVNLSMAGQASQTGLEIIKRTPHKPAIVLVEINDTIERKINSKLIDYVYQPVLHELRYYLSMFRQEYQPVSVFVNSLKSKQRTNENETANPKLKEKLIEQKIAQHAQPLSDEEKQLIIQEVEYLKVQIDSLKKVGVRVILFDVPIEQRIQNTTKQKQIRELFISLLPSGSFEWLAEPPAKNWVTSDGLHLIPAEAQEYSQFIQQQLLNPIP